MYKDFCKQKSGTVQDREETMPMVVNLSRTQTSMKAIEEYLPGDRFMRIHRSFIVNLSKVTLIERNRIVFDGNTYIPVSKQYKAKLQDFLDQNFL